MNQKEINQIYKRIEIWERMKNQTPEEGGVQQRQRSGHRLRHD